MTQFGGRFWLIDTMRSNKPEQATDSTDVTKPSLAYNRDHMFKKCDRDFGCLRNLVDRPISESSSCYREKMTR